MNFSFHDGVIISENGRMVQWLDGFDLFHSARNTPTTITEAPTTNIGEIFSFSQTIAMGMEKMGYRYENMAASPTSIVFWALLRR